MTQTLYFDEPLEGREKTKPSLTVTKKILTDLPRKTVGVKVYCALRSWRLEYAENDDRAWSKGGVKAQANYEPDSSEIVISIEAEINDGNGDDGIIMTADVLVILIAPTD